MRIRKVRVSATIRQDLARALDRAGPNRSAVLESILERWAEEASRRDLDRETARYYKKYASAERREEEAWVKRAAGRLVRHAGDGADD